MSYGKFLNAILGFALALSIVAGAPAQAADKARLSGLSDVAFGMIAVTSDQFSSQSVCAYTSSSTGGYSLVATGSGSAGSFALTSGATDLPYEVLWADSANQTGGTALVAGAVTSGFTSTASQHFCNSGPPTSASLTVVIRAIALSAARAGDYSGSLQVTIVPE
jgi:hypothetical protein